MNQISSTAPRGWPAFESRYTQRLPADPIQGGQRRQVHGACYSFVDPTQVPKPILVAHAREVAELLGFSEDLCRSPEFAQVMAGNRLLEGMQPYAMCYGGHQFGNWAGQLGDGRAINLGEVVNDAGQRWTLQLKGSGPTPYSRSADGRAVLRSSVREFLCSEAMFHLGVPTTRALSLVTTGESIVRDMFYDGNAKPEPGAVVCRVAPSFVRFGNFQIFASRGEVEPLRALLDYTIETDFPDLGEPSVSTYVRWFEEVCRLTALMIVHWMRVGFVHGVMNTDNLSVLGLTIDYGPYGWLDNYDPNWTPNTTDAQGKRYRFAHQPQIAMWNLAQLGNALVPLVEDVNLLQEALQVYAKTFETQWDNMMAAKLGLDSYNSKTDEPLVSDLQRVLQMGETDMTIFYRRLSRLSSSRDQAMDERMEILRPSFYVEPSSDHVDQLSDWLARYCKRLGEGASDDQSRRKKMNRVNPKYVLRNYLAQLAIDKAETGDYSLIEELMEVMRHPYDTQPQKERFAALRPDWARSRPGCSMLSCSS